MISLNKFYIFFSYLAIYLIWGTTYFFIRRAVIDIRPFYVVGFRFLIGGAFLLLLALLRSEIKKNITPKQILNSAISGIVLLVGANGIVTYTEQYVESYYIALVFTISPMVMILVDYLFIRKPITFGSKIGIPFGLSGLFLLVLNGHSENAISILHLTMLFLALCFWALGSTMSKIISKPSSLLVHSGIQLSAAGIFGILIAIVMYREALPDILANITYSKESFASLLYLAIPGTLALFCYSYLLKHEPMEKIVSYTLVNPVIALIVGIYIGKETAIGQLPISIVAILVGVALIFYGDSLKEKLLKR